MMRSLLNWTQRQVIRRLFAPLFYEMVGPANNRVWWLDRRARYILESLGRIESRQLADRRGSLHDHEFRVYSQWGEDGIIDHLVRHVPVGSQRFVEFGVEDYQEANTRFLMIHRNWAGLVLDADGEAIERIRSDRDYWLHDLTAVRSYITRDNINRLLSDHGFAGDVGLLSVDIDGMDWWIWDAIDAVDPAIVVAEYNFRFGPELAVTVPYQAQFDRRTAHHSLLYYGASLRALARLGERKGYDLVGCNSAGLNAFFVKRSLRPEAIPALTVDEAFVAGRFGEGHDPQGRRVRMSYEQQHEQVMSLPVVEVDEQGRADVDAPGRVMEPMAAGGVA